MSTMEEGKYPGISRIRRVLSLAQLISIHVLALQYGGIVPAACFRTNLQQDFAIMQQGTIRTLSDGRGPRVVVSTAAFHARVRGSVPGLGGLKETKMFLPHPRVKVSIVGSLRDREVACSASDRQGSNFESCVWRTVSSQSSHHPQEVLLAQFSLYVHKGGLKPDSFHYPLGPAGKWTSKEAQKIPITILWCFYMFIFNWCLFFNSRDHMCLYMKSRVYTSQIWSVIICFFRGDIKCGWS